MSLIRRFFGFVWRLLDGLRKVLHLLLLLIVFTILFAAFRQPVPLVPAKAALVIKPEGALVEELSGDALDRAVGDVTGDREPETLVTDVVDAIEAGAKDDRIHALVLLTEDMTGGGLAKANAIARAIAQFRKTGKKVYAWGQYVTQPQYYLMAQADEVYLEPIGAVGVEGYSSLQPYFRTALDKVGVTVNAFRSGPYKSIAEPFIRDDMSPEIKAETKELLDSQWAAYTAGVSGPRRLAAGALDSYVGDPVSNMRATNGDQALMAEKLGLVTGRRTWDEFERIVAKVVGEDEDSHSFNAIDQNAYLAVARSQKVLGRHPAGTIAVITATGNIVDGSQAPGNIGGDTLARVLRDAQHDDDVKAVVLRIDSGGGSVLASEVIRQQVEAVRKAGKPVVASFSSVAASGAYYFSTAADEIWAEPTTITGSIGVIAFLPTFEGLLGKVGVAFDGVATSELASSARVDKPLSPQLRDVLQMGVDHEYRNFLKLVADARDKTPAEIDAIAQGRVWSGAKAKELGLVDELGGLPEAIDAAARLAKLAKGQYGVDYRQQPMNWRQQLARDLGAASVRAGLRLGVVTPASSRARPVERLVSGVDRELGRLAAFNDPRHLYYFCNCTAP
jgi:protease-4